MGPPESQAAFRMCARHGQKWQALWIGLTCDGRWRTLNVHRYGPSSRGVSLVMHMPPDARPSSVGARTPS